MLGAKRVCNFRIFFVDDFIHLGNHVAGAADFKKIADEKGLLKPGVKAGEIVAWLKKDFGLGHGHAMAIYATFKGMKEWK